MPINREINREFFREWSSEMAYVLGFFAADGSMIKNKRGGHYIEFHVADREVLVKIKEAMSSSHKIANRGKKKENWKELYRLQIGSRKIFEDLMSLGFTPKKSKILRFPDVPEKYIPDFVRGYFDGDGCVYFKQHFAKDRQKMRWFFTSLFTCGNRKFLEDLHVILQKYAKVQGGSIKEKERGYELTFSRLDSLALYLFMYNNAPCSRYLKRKKEKFRKAIETLGYFENAVVV